MNLDSSDVTLSLDRLKALLEQVFLRNGCSRTVAAVLSENCASAEAAGSFSHGIFRIDGYVSTLRSGWVDGRAEPEVTVRSSSFLHVDAANGFAQPALKLARPQLVERVRQNGIACLAIGNSHHFGALWPDVQPFAEEGLIAISMVNSFACSIPAGAVRPLLGTNPFAFAAPVPGKAPLVFDFATTSMANGDVQLAAREGRAVPLGTGVDRDGNPTSDAQAILDGGALVPFGGHKGSAISLMVELMVAGLSGGNFSFEVDWSTHPGAQTPHTGQIFIVIDPTKSGGNGFASRSEILIDQLQEAGLTAYPGVRRWQKRDVADVALSRHDLQRIEDYAAGRR